MSGTSNKAMFRLMAEQFNEEQRDEFESLGSGGHYTDNQRSYAFELIDQNGIRATAKILKVPRRTLQRWCRKYHIHVKMCPEWVYGWAERRRKRREFWQLRGYC
jgi:hypothetical protein